MLSSNGHERGREENPVARLKLLLVRTLQSFRLDQYISLHTPFQIVSFLTLHILNLCTPLTSPRYNAHPIVPSRKVDIGDNSILPVLTLLAEFADPSLDLIVKVPPPIYIRILPLSSSYGGASEMLENFMSSWTRLVGDPVLSKWIVLVLAVSVSLNGYLLKGIAAGLARHGGAVFKWDQSEAEKQVVISGPTTITPPNGTTTMTAFANGSATTGTIILNGLAPRRASFTLESLDMRLQRPRRLAPGPSSDDEREEDEETEGEEEPRTLEELVHIFENGPKPQSVALALLSDEEVVLLAQNGKIAAYALEKVLGNLERAVKIRRALICGCLHARFEFELTIHRSHSESV
jgi:hydroxymethylglutaryl-CoA reductase (NADPH)